MHSLEGEPEPIFHTRELLQRSKELSFSVDCWALGVTRSSSTIFDDPQTIWERNRIEKKKMAA